MRRLTLGVTVAVVVAACSPGGGGALPGSGSGFCDESEKIAAEFEQMDTEGMEFTDIYGLMADAYGRLIPVAPAELKDDLELVAEVVQDLDEWYQAGNTGEPPISDAEQEAFDAANQRISAYMETECGIDDGEGDPEAEGFEEETVGVAEETGELNRATLTVTVGGETYTEELSGEMAVSCDMYGPLEDGSIGIYLLGEDFEASVSSNDSGVTPGTYDGRIWVFGSDPDLDEMLYGLQEFDGPFILDDAYEVADELWFFTGSFSLTASEEWPAASVNATFSCVGPVGF